MNMAVAWKLGCLGVIIALCYAWMLLRLSRESGKLYADMDDIRNRASNTHDIEAMRALRLELCIYCDKHCWHRAHSDYAQRVLNYIDGWLSHMAPYETVSTTASTSVVTRDMVEEARAKMDVPPWDSIPPLL